MRMSDKILIIVTVILAVGCLDAWLGGMRAAVNLKPDAKAVCDYEKILCNEMLCCVPCTARWGEYYECYMTEELSWAYGQVLQKKRWKRRGK